MVGETACLGLEILGKCSYDPSAPNQSSFTIGQLISVIALLLAFSQLTKPIIKFRISANKVSYKIAIFASGFAIGCIFIATILPFIPGKAWPLLGYPVVWEILAGLIFVVVAGRLLWAISKAPCFHAGNADAYLKACGAVIAKGNEDDLGELAEEIAPAVKSVLDGCNLYSHRAAREVEERGQEYQIEESTRIAFTLLDLWSDKAFCRNIVCRAPFTALKIFDELIQHTSHAPGYALSGQLVHQAFMNRESMLMREEDYSGLGFFKTFRNTVFGNWRFIQSEYRPLQSWRSYEEPVHSWQVEKYCECLNASLEAYLISQEYSSKPSPLYVGLNKLADLAISPAFEIRNANDKTSLPSRVTEVLHEIESGFEEIIRLIEEHHGRLPAYEFEEDKYDRFKDESIYGIVAYAIYRYFEHLSMAKRHDSLIRTYASGIWFTVLGVIGSKSQAVNEIGKRLIVHLNKKVDENLDAKERWYPLITRLILSLHGIHEPQQAEKPNETLENRFHKEFIERLKMDLPKLAKVDLAFAEELLPEGFTYDRANNTLIHKQRRQQTDVLKLAATE